MDEIQRTLASRINALLFVKGITVAQLSRDTGVSRETIDRILKRSHNTRLSTIVKIAQALEVDMDYLFKGMGNGQQEQIEDVPDAP